MKHESQKNYITETKMAALRQLFMLVAVRMCIFLCIFAHVFWLKLVINRNRNENGI